MKKLTFMIIAAAALMIVSCGKKMSPEAQKAWNDFKACADKIDTDEKVDKFTSIEEFNQVVQDWQKAAKEMESHATEYSKEITDSMDAITNKVKPVMEKVEQAVAEGVAEGIAEGLAETEGAEGAETEE
jgi:flagellar biosynthesis/type III secretory pathway protein FliH